MLTFYIRMMWSSLYLLMFHLWFSGYGCLAMDQEGLLLVEPLVPRQRDLLHQAHGTRSGAYDLLDAHAGDQES